MLQITAPELAAWLADPARPAPTLLDVREPWEVQTCALPGIVAIPLREVPVRSSALSQDGPIVCICHHGARSAQAAMFLASRGFEDVINLQGGMDAWSRQVDPSVPVY
ncbi:MAG: rhodanese-like domain-containing protein [Janthinobacterium lividum]